MGVKARGRLLTTTRGGMAKGAVAEPSSGARVWRSTYRHTRRARGGRRQVIGEVLLGLFTLALGWVCLRHAFYHRRKGYPKLTARSPKSDEHGNKPLMLMPLVLGTLFMLIGVKLLAWALLELFRRHFTNLP